MDAVRKVRIGMAGCGTVGGGVVALLAQQGEAIAGRCGVALQLDRVLVRDADRDRPAELPREALTTDASALLAPDIDLVIEVLGGCGTARDLVLAAIRAGKPVVTANKALMAEHGPEVFAAAASAGVAVGFEASCCGGVPIISALQRGLVANRIDALYAIVNGTCNYILTEMLESRRSYADALADAQRLGYAEADPTLDVDGTDSAHKLAILAGLAFDAPIDYRRVGVEGIERLELCDLLAGYEQGYVCKLMAVARCESDGLVLQVVPAFMETSHPLAHVRGPYNAVSVYGHAVGHTLYYGRGAGAGPTASAVVADVIDLVRRSPSSGPDPLRPRRTGSEAKVQYKPLDALCRRYYLRFMVQDRPGVMAEITRVFADQGISLSAITQRDPHDETCRQVVTIGVITHRAREGALRQSLRLIEGIDAVTRTPVAIRIIEEHEEF